MPSPSSPFLYIIAFPLIPSYDSPFFTIYSYSQNIFIFQLLANVFLATIYTHLLSSYSHFFPFLSVFFLCYYFSTSLLPTLHQNINSYSAYDTWAQML